MLHSSSGAGLCYLEPCYTKQWHHVAYAQWQDQNGNWSGWTSFFDQWGPNGQSATGYADGNTYSDPTQTVWFGADDSPRYISFHRKTQDFTWEYCLYSGYADRNFREDTGDTISTWYTPAQYGASQYHTETHYVGWSGTWTYQPSGYESHTWSPGSRADFQYSTCTVIVHVYYQHKDGSYDSGGTDLTFNIPHTCRIHVCLVQAGYKTQYADYYINGGSPSWSAFYWERP